MLKMLTKPRRRQIQVGPQDNGKPTSLSDFDKAVAQEGYCYELGKGIIEVSDVPHPSHFFQLQELRDPRVPSKGIIASSPMNIWPLASTNTGSSTVSNSK